MARQAAQKEATDAKKKKKAEVARWKYEKEKITRRVKAGENKSDVKSELESEDPTEVEDMIFSEEEESHEVIMTSVEHHDPTAMSAGSEQEPERRGVVPTLRKHAASVDAIGEQEAKQTWSPRPSEVSPAQSPPAPVRRSKLGSQRSGLAPMHHRGQR